MSIKLIYKLHTHDNNNLFKSMQVNVNKTKVMISGESCKGVHNTGRWPCDVCGRGVGRNPIVCIKCQKWVHKCVQV